MSEPVSREAQGATLVDLERRCSRLLRSVALVAVLAALGAVSGTVAVVQLGRVAKKADNNAATSNTALCALRTDLEKRVVNSQQFLREHPHGIQDIPAKTIRDGIVNQKRTIVALSVLECATP